jgi:hypothetical protein
VSDDPYRAPETADVTPHPPVRMTPYPLVRILALLLAVLAFVSLVYPQSETGSTMMGFPPGSPNPNTHTTTYTHGWPLPWLTWKHSWNESRGTESSGLHSLNRVNLIVHTLSIVVPASLFFLTRSEKPKAVSKKDDYN